MPQESPVKPLSSSQEDLERMRHSTAHLMAAAIQQLWPEARFGVGPAVEHGFYYDVLVPVRITDEDLGKIETKMRELRNKKLPYERIEVPIQEAIDKMEMLGQTFKVELLQLLKEKGSTAVAEETGDSDAVGGGVDQVSLYKTGEFLDLCRGPHVENTTQIGAFKLMSLAGAFWRGNEKNPQLQRVYGAAFLTKEDLEKHLFRIEEAKKRDHRRLGPQLDLFTFSDLVGPGLPLFTPKGTLIRRLIEEFVQSLQEPLGYQRVAIPHITRNELYKISGHWEKFSDDLFHVTGKGGDDFCMKPMNCPHHTQIYASKPRSYRDLPLRYSEVTTVYRDELPGVLQGLSRVRSITQDDAHVFCRPDQIAEEAGRIYNIVDTFYQAFNMQLSVRLSLWDERTPDKYLGGPDVWNLSQGMLRDLLKSRGVAFHEEAGEAAFYGPKIDFTAQDALGRAWQLATIQLDYNLPNRFDLNYVATDGSHARPVMIHRAILGSVERFMSVLIEHYAGAFPTWLAPVQAMIVPIADRHIEYAEKLHERLRTANPPSLLQSLRVEVDASRESMQKKIRNAQLLKIPYMLVVGDSEVEKGEVSVRLRSGVDLKSMPVDALLDRLRQEVTGRQDIV
ncbi:MAG TPA: threonine--tRNA ligase [Candidatus Xenobia bacterium]|jgi:threonyl-tRNA synthetase